MAIASAQRASTNWNSRFTCCFTAPPGPRFLSRCSLLRYRVNSFIGLVSRNDIVIADCRLHGYRRGRKAARRNRSNRSARSFSRAADVKLTIVLYAYNNIIYRTAYSCVSKSDTGYSGSGKFSRRHRADVISLRNVRCKLS